MLLVDLPECPPAVVKLLTEFGPQGPQGEVGPVGPMPPVPGGPGEVVYNEAGQWGATAAFRWDSTTNTLILNSAARVSEAAGALVLGAGGVDYWTLDPAGVLRPLTDNALDIGTLAERVRSLYVQGVTAGDITATNITADSITAGSGGVVTPPGAPVIIGGDTYLYRDGPNALAQRNGVSPQTFRVYNNYIDESNFERAALRFTSNVAYLVTEAAGVGLARALSVGTNTAQPLYLRTANQNRWMVTSDGNLDTANDNLYDLGSNNRPRNIFAATGFTAGFHDATMNLAGLRLAATSSLVWTSGDARDPVEVALVREGNGILAQRNALAPQTFRLYATYTGLTDYERLTLAYAPATGFSLKSEAAGAGTTRALNLDAFRLGFYIGGAEKWRIAEASGNLLAATDNTVDIGASGASRPRHLFLGSNLVAGGTAAIAGGTLYFGASSDAMLVREGANALAMRSGINPQAFRLYNTYTDGSNLERGGLSWSANVLRLTSEALGTGVARDLSLIAANELNLGSTNSLRWKVNTGGGLLAFADNLYDIGSTAAGRPRNIYSANAIYGGSVFVRGSSGQLGIHSRTGDVLAWGVVADAGKLQFYDYAAGVYRWQFADTGAILAVADNAYDIGAASANRPRDLHLARDLSVGGGLKVVGVHALPGNLLLGWAAGTGGTIQSYSTTPLTLQPLGQAVVIGAGSPYLVFGNSGGAPVLRVGTAGMLEQRDGVQPMGFRVFNTYTDTSNYERGTLEWSGNSLYVQTLAGGTGIGRSLVVRSAANLHLGGGGALQWQITSAGHLLAATDNTVDIGSSGALRPRDVYIARDLVLPVLTDWSGVTAGRMALISASTNSHNGVTATQGAYFPHSNAGYGLEISGRQDAMWYRTQENAVWGPWRTVVNQEGQQPITGSKTLTNPVIVGTMSHRDGTNPQAYYTYNTYTDPSNYERGRVAWVSNIFYIGTDRLGTGLARDVAVQAASGANLWLGSGGAQWRIDLDGFLLTDNDNLRDIGLAGSKRPRDLHVARDVNAARNVSALGKFLANMPGDPANAQIELGGATMRWLDWSTVGISPPALTTRSMGTKAVWYKNLSASSFDYATGVETGHVWFSTGTGWKWYGGAGEFWAEMQARAYRIYNAYTDASNYERAALEWSSNTLYLRTVALGTGLPRAMILGTEGSATIILRTNATNRWAVHATNGNFNPASDNTVSIGEPGARIAYLRAGTSVEAPQVRTSTLTVATLPAVAANEGARCFVSDATLAAAGNFGAVVVGGGANKVPVFSDGAAWRIG